MSSRKESCVIRKAEPKDCEDILALIQELANYEKMPNGPTLDPETLRKDGFGEETMFHCFVAEDVINDVKQIVCYSLYYYIYSTWDGVCIYLEDLYVKPEYRHLGIGTKLWKAVAKVAVEKGCKRLDWACLDWNKSSCEYYKAKGARNITDREGWHLFRLDGNSLTTFAAE